MRNAAYVTSAAAGGFCANPGPALFYRLQNGTAPASGLAVVLIGVAVVFVFVARFFKVVLQLFLRFPATLPHSPYLLGCRGR